MVAKCGEVRVWHWAHKGRLLCDPWWENETKWHRDWKDEFPADWQEIVHAAGDGERHIADVKTDGGWVIEFQNSHIQPEERRSRETFYPKLIWVVNGTRRKRDAEQFLNAFNAGLRVGAFRRAFSDGCVLLRESPKFHVAAVWKATIRSAGY
jgi:competence protein CoiA